MNIAYITDQILPQNATDTEQILNMVSALGGAGADVTLLAPARYFRTPATREDICAYYEVEPTFRIETRRSLYPSQRGIEKAAHAVAACRTETVRRADLLYTRNIPVLFAALAAGRPVIYETYRPWPRQKRWMGAMFRALATSPHFLGAVLHSNLARESYLAAGVPGKKLLVAHNGYDPRKIAPKRSKTEARQELSLPVEGSIAAYAGHISEQKGIGLLLDMAEALPEITFVLVGSRKRGPIERRAESMPNVRIVGWQRFSKTVPYLYASDVLLIPPTAGPLDKVGNTVLPIKTFLYMATGRTILGPSTPDLQELLRDGENACLVEPDRSRESIEALRALLGDRARLDRLSARIEQDAAGLTWERRATAVLDFIRERLHG